MRGPEKITVVTAAGAIETREPVAKCHFNGIECLKLSNPRNPANPLIASPEGTASLIPVAAVIIIHIEPLAQKPSIVS